MVMLKLIQSHNILCQNLLYNIWNVSFSWKNYVKNQLLYTISNEIGEQSVQFIRNINLNTTLLLGAQLPHCATSSQTTSGEDVFFLLTYPTSDLMLIHHQVDEGTWVSTVFKNDTFVPRFLSGLAEKFL